MAFNDKAYVSGISLADTREIMPKVVDIQNTIGLTDIAGAVNRYKPVSQTIFHNYVNKPLWVVGVSTGTITGSGSATVSGALTAGTSGNARLNDMVRFEDGSVGYVSVLTPGASDAFTIKSVDGTNLTHVSGQSIYFFSNVVGEASTARTNQRRDLTKYYQLIQNFRESNEETDLNRMTTTEMEWDGKKYFYQKDLIEKWLKLKAEVNAAMWQSKISVSQFTTSTSALVDPGGGGIMQTQRGIDQYIASYGSTRTVDSLGTCDLDDIAKFIDLAVAKKADLDFMVFGSIKAMRPIADHLKGIGSSGVVSANLSVDGASLNFNIEKLAYNTANFQFVGLPILNHPEVTAADIQKCLYFIPTGKVKAQSSTEGATAMENRLQIRYMKSIISHNQINQGNDIWYEFHDGAASPVTPSGRQLVWTTDWGTSQAIEMLGVEHAGRMKVN